MKSFSAPEGKEKTNTRRKQGHVYSLCHTNAFHSFRMWAKIVPIRLFLRLMGTTHAYAEPPTTLQPKHVRSSMVKIRFRNR